MEQEVFLSQTKPFNWDINDMKLPQVRYVFKLNCFLVTLYEYVSRCQAIRLVPYRVMWTWLNVASQFNVLPTVRFLTI